MESQDIAPTVLLVSNFPMRRWDTMAKILEVLQTILTKIKDTPLDTTSTATTADNESVVEDQPPGSVQYNATTESESAEHVDEFYGRVFR